MIHSNPSRSSTRGPRRRGVAMMLVLISLAVATIITSAYVASRDNSSLIGQNAVASAGARQAAISGIELGVSILQTESGWRVNHIDGRLLEAFPLDGGGEFDLDLIDAETNMPPTEETRIVEMTATARVDGIAETATAVAEIFGGGEDAGSIDVDLSEFGVFVSEKLRMEEFATINRWSSSPLADLGNGINVGTQADTAGSVELIGDAAAIDTTVFTGPTPSGSLVRNAGGPSITVTSLLDVIPMPDPPTPGFAAPADFLALPMLEVSMTNAAVSADGDYQWINVGAMGKLTLNGKLNINAGILRVDMGGRLLIDGDVTLAVLDNVNIENTAAIELMPGATLTLFVGNTLNISDGYVGDGPSAEWDPSGNARWMEPDRLTVYSLPTTPTDTYWNISGMSVVKGRLYGTKINLGLRNTAAFYGSVVANDVLMLESAAIFYDHTLDSGNGYTAPNSDVFDESDHILPELLSLASLDTADLQALADTLSVAITNGRDTLDGSGTLAVVEEEPKGSDTTPRPLLVEYEMTSIGGDSSAWEGT